jgi:hypothetical protein
MGRMELLFAFGGFFFPFGILLLGAIVLAVIAIGGRRTAADPTGRRPMAIYLLSVMFVSLLTAAGAVAQVGETLADLAGDKFATRAPIPELPPPVATLEPGQEIPPEARDVAAAGFVGLPPDPNMSQFLEAGLVGLLSAAIFEFHRRKWRELLRKERGDG